MEEGYTAEAGAKRTSSLILSSYWQELVKCKLTTSCGSLVCSHNLSDVKLIHSIECINSFVACIILLTLEHVLLICTHQMRFTHCANSGTG